MTVPVVLTALDPGETPWYYIDGTNATYLALVSQLNNNTTQTTGVLSNYGTDTLLDTFALFATIVNLNQAVDNLHEYVQAVAMTGVDPTEIGDANDIVAINNIGDGFTGIPQTTFVTSSQYSSEQQAILERLAILENAANLFESSIMY